MKKILSIAAICIIILMAVPLVADALKIDNPLKYDNISDIIKAITDLLKVLAIGVGTIMIIISGLQYITSAGSEEKAGKAKKTILYTIIGVAIVIAVDFIVGFVGEILGKVVK
jgi:amino acid transporter